MRGALAARLELEILLEAELVGERAALGPRAPRRAPDEGALSPDEAVAAFRRLAIGSESLAAELGSPAGIRLFARMIPVGAAAVAGGRSGLPRLLRSGLASSAPSRSSSASWAG